MVKNQSKAKLTWFFLVLCLTLQVLAQEKNKDTKDPRTNNENIVGLTDLEVSQLRNKYRNEKDEKEKIYMEVALHPEKYDKNKDRKISRNELKAALIYLIFPKTKAEKLGLNKRIKEIVKSKIDVYVTSKPEFISFPQFSRITMEIHENQFVNPGVFDDIIKSEQAGLGESVLDI
jgi:hypothetical protein